jgi:hypothetical protein
MQKPNSDQRGRSNAPASLHHTRINSLDPRERLAACMRQMRVQKLIDQMRLEHRFWQAMEARRRLAQRPASPLAGGALFRALDEAAAWLVRHLDHPDAATVIAQLDRLAPGWRGGKGGPQQSEQGGR